jgi:putative ABC transport system permease protein
MATTLPDILISDRTAATLGLAIGDTVDLAADAGMSTTRSFKSPRLPEARPVRDRLRAFYSDALTGLESRPRARIESIASSCGCAIRPARGRDRRSNATMVGLRAYTSEDLAARTSSTFQVVSQFHKAIGVVSLLAGLVFLVAIMVLKVEAMRRELGVLRLLGISRRTVVRSVLAIATLVALLGSLVGIGLGIAAAALVNPLAQHRYDTDLVFVRVTPSVIALAVGLSIVLGIAAGAGVAARSARAHPLRQIGR